MIVKRTLTLNVHNPHGIILLKRLRVGLSHLRERKFRKFRPHITHFWQLLLRNGKKRIQANTECRHRMTATKLAISQML